MDGKIGTWAFVIGLILAVIAGLIPTLQTQSVILALVVLGLIVGFLNVTEKETTEFLVATIALMLVGSAGAIPVLGLMILSILSNIVAFVAPAALVVALKAIWALAEK